MAKKIILDVDPGVVEATVLAMALFDTSLDVVAVTSVGGNVPSEVAAKNLQSLVHYLDPPRQPRLGFGTDPEGGLPADRQIIYGASGLGNPPFPVTGVRSPYPADKLIAEMIRQHPQELTIIALGPLTNIARAFARDSELASLVRHLYICGGAVACGGNVTPAAEFNIFSDPESARHVFQSVCTKTLIPLDVTNAVSFTLGQIQQFPSETTLLGSLLRGMFLPTLAASHRELGRESIHVHELVAYLVAISNDSPVTRVMAGDVELEGTLTRGATIFDRRQQSLWKKNMEVAIKIDTDSVAATTLASLADTAAVIESR
ncbi:MAG: nucleoside hydrolase [Thermoguttaceae bacterium]